MMHTPSIHSAHVPLAAIVQVRMILRFRFPGSDLVHNPVEWVTPILIFPEIQV
jgi:hypothetical protein